MRNRAALIAAGLAVAVAWLVWSAFTDHQLGVTFKKIALGDTRDRVIELMGAPHKVHKGCGYFRTKPAPACVEEYLYLPFWTRWLDEVWSVSLDADGRVVGSYHLLSP